MNKALLPIITFAKNDIKRLFRDKLGIFFVFIFPLIFLFVFGGLFGRDSDVSFTVFLENKSESEFSQNFVTQLQESDIFELNEDIVTIDEAREQLTRGSIDAIIVLPENFGEVASGQSFPSGQAEVIYDRGSEQAGMTLKSIMESIFTEINGNFVQIEPLFTVEATPSESEGLTTMDYLFPGLLGFTILSLGVFGPVNVFPRLKEKGVLRRYHMTPIRVWQYFAGNVLSNVAIGLIAVTLMFIVAMIFFDVTMKGNYLNLLFVVILGSITIFGIGLAIGGWARNENQAAPLGNLVSFPMMFLSGVFFPRFLMPEWLQNVSSFFPLTPLIDGLRLVITEGKSLLEIGPEIGLLAGWLVIVYAIAFNVFRWE